MKKLDRYIIAEANSLPELESQVIMYAKIGMVPLGGLIYTENSISKYKQPMVKYKRRWL